MDSKTTAYLLRMLVDRDARKRDWERDSYYGGYTDEHDRSMIESISDTLGRRIDGLEKGPPEPKKPWEE